MPKEKKRKGLFSYANRLASIESLEMKLNDYEIEQQIHNTRHKDIRWLKSERIRSHFDH